MQLPCPLCHTPETNSFQMEGFFRCPKCFLIFKDPELHLPLAEEKERYELHENNIEDPRYVAFLWPVIEELKKLKPRNSVGLDYGSGPNPVLVELLKKEGYQATGYDPHFLPIDLSLLPAMDFIVSTEAAEHFYRPAEEFNAIFKLLKPDGVLILMTDFFQENMNLEKWHYVRDPTHVCFYSAKNLEFIAQAHQRSASMISHRLCVIH